MTVLARLISIVGHPFATALIMVGAAAAHFGPAADAPRTMALVAALTLLPVTGLMIRQVRRGSWSNVDASDPRQRPVLFAVGIGGVLLLLAYVLAVQPESYMVRGVVGTLAMLGVCAAATRWLKVSLHMAFCALAATTLLWLRSPAGWVLLIFIPILGWSRLRLGRHVAAEVIAGTIVGVVAGVAIHGV
ncbi:MAG: hypothetical protein ABI609_08410 [Acidobacteriota bacterium]